MFDDMTRCVLKVPRRRAPDVIRVSIIALHDYVLTAMVYVNDVVVAIVYSKSGIRCEKTKPRLCIYFSN